MRLTIQTIAQTPNSTASMLLIDERFFCWVLEDGEREKKVKHETRIPSGIYPIKKATSGRFYNLYKKRYNHEFAIYVDDVPGFTGIMIHIGNTIKDTSGCPLVNRNIGLGVDGNFLGTDSASVYRQLYSLLAAAFERNEKILLEVNRLPKNAQKSVL
jgi:hypothetical protein